MAAFFQLPISVYLKLLIATIAVIIFCRWLAKKLIKNGKSKAYSINAKRLIYAGFSYLAFTWLVYKVITYERQSKFNRDKWVTEKYRRHEMAKDLIQSGIMAGKDSNEVKTILGEPDNRNDSLQTWNYNMGQGGGGPGFTIHYLVVKFSADSVSTIWHQKIVD